MGKPGKQGPLTVIAMNIQQDAITRFFEFVALITAIIYASSLASNGSFGDGVFKTFGNCDDTEAIKVYLRAQAFTVNFGLVSTVLCLITILATGIVNRPSGRYTTVISEEDYVKFTPWRRFFKVIAVVVVFMGIVLTLTCVQAARMIQTQNFCERKIWCQSQDTSLASGTLTVSVASFDSICDGYAKESYGPSSADCYGCSLYSKLHSHGIVAWAVGGFIMVSTLIAAVYFKYTGRTAADTTETGTETSKALRL